MEHLIEDWPADRVPELVELARAALPGEDLSEDELLACCWEDPAPGAPGEGAVLGTADGAAAAAVVWRARPPSGEAARYRPGAFVKLVVVHPDARRQGRGHALLEAAEAWAWARGADELRLEGSPPFYLWPGVDALAIEALCLAEARGYEVVGTGLNLSLPSGFRAPTPEGVAIRRVIEERDVGSVRALVDEAWPAWWPETARAIEQGCCHGAFAASGPAGGPGGPAIGFAGHSVSRTGWLGPMGTHPGRRRGGVGRALLSAVCRDLMIAELPTVEVCWAGPLRFYARSGATVSRVFRQYRKPRP